MRNSEYPKETGKERVYPTIESNFERGRNGMRLMFVAFSLLGISGIFLFLFGPINIFRFAAALLIGISVTVCSFSFFRILKVYYYESSAKEKAFIKFVSICSIIFAWWLFFSETFQFGGGVWELREYYHYGAYIYYVHGPFFPQFVVLQTIGFILLGIVLIFWTIAISILRNIFESKILAFAAAAFFGIAAIIIIISMFGYLVNGVGPWIIGQGGVPYGGFMFVAVFAGPASILIAILFQRGCLRFNDGGKVTKSDLEGWRRPSPLPSKSEVVSKSEKYSHYGGE
jgi:hypothetical protein